MPMREFVCERGHRTERIVAPDAEDPRYCSAHYESEWFRDIADGGVIRCSGPCGRIMTRVMSVPASVFPNADGWRK